MTANNIGILLTNIGTPAAPTTSAVRSYLREFLSDPRVVEFPRALWLPILYGYILMTRPRHSAKLYQKIWTDNGSPLLIYSRNIAQALQKNLSLPVALGMHYGKPSIESALTELRNNHVEKVLILPLYPQYSATTTASSFDMVARALKSWRNIPEIRMVRDYAEDKNYLDALSKSVIATWNSRGVAEHLLFSFHGIPKNYNDSGDPYRESCFQTAKRLAEKLGLKPDTWSVSFQSRLGKTEWLQPYTENVLAELPQRGVHSVQVICPGFAVDCLETLEEIAIRGKESFFAHGGKEFFYIPALNDGMAQVQMLAKLVRHHIQNWLF